MTPLHTPEEVKQYRDRLRRQKVVLSFSTAFTETEKEEVMECYQKIRMICDAMLAKSINVTDEETL